MLFLSATTALIRRWLAKRPQYHVHFTPTGASWINLVERFFALLTEKQIRRGIHRSTRELEQVIRHHLDIYNETAQPFVWTKTAEQILASVARFCQSANFSYRTLAPLDLRKTHTPKTTVAISPAWPGSETEARRAATHLESWIIRDW